MINTLENDIKNICGKFTYSTGTTGAFANICSETSSGTDCPALEGGKCPFGIDVVIKSLPIASVYGPINVLGFANFPIVTSDMDGAV